MKRTLIVVAVVVLVLALLAPGLVGLLAQNRHEDQLELAMRASPHIQFVAGEFDRGWFSSRGRYRVELSDELQRAAQRDATTEDPAGALPALIIESHLIHGPFALATAFRNGGTLLPVLGTVESKLTLISDGETLFELPGPVVTNIHLDGGGTTSYTSGPVNFDEGGERVSWGGADIVAEFNAGATHIESEGRIEALTAVDDEGGFESAPISFSGEQTLTEYGFWTGESLVDAARISYVGADQQTVLESFRLQYAVRMPQEYVVGTVEMSLAGLRAGEWMGGPAVIRIEFAHLEPVALGQLVNEVRAMSMRSEPDARQAGTVMGQASEKLGALLANGAIFALEELRVQTPDGEVFAKLRLEFPENVDAGAGNVLLLAGGLDGDLSLRLPQSLVAAASGANPESQQYLQMLLESGFIEVQEEYYVVDAEYSGGLLTVNGIPVPIPFGGASPQAVE